MIRWAGNVPGAQRELIDELLDFGSMQMIVGKAFAIGPEGEGSQLPPAILFKSWEHFDNRTFLIESVPYLNLKPHLEQLPVSGRAAVKKEEIKKFARNELHNAALAKRVLPAPRMAQVENRPLQIASVPVRQKGVILDYVIVFSDSDWIFRGDTTYYVS